MCNTGLFVYLNCNSSDVPRPLRPNGGTGEGDVPLQPLRFTNQLNFPNNLPLTDHGFSYIISILPTSFLRGGGGHHPPPPRSVFPYITE